MLKFDGSRLSWIMTTERNKITSLLKSLYSFVDPYPLLVRRIDHCEGNKMFFVFLRWGKSRTVWRSTYPVWPPIFSVAVSSKFIGLHVFLFNPPTSLQYLYLGSHVSYPTTYFTLARLDVGWRRYPCKKIHERYYTWSKMEKSATIFTVVSCLQWGSAVSVALANGLSRNLVVLKLNGSYEKGKLVWNETCFIWHQADTIFRSNGSAYLSARNKVQYFNIFNVLIRFFTTYFFNSMKIFQAGSGSVSGRIRIYVSGLLNLDPDFRTTDLRTRDTKEFFTDPKHCCLQHCVVVSDPRNVDAHTALAFLCVAEPDPTFHFDVNPDPAFSCGYESLTPIRIRLPRILFAYSEPLLRTWFRIRIRRIHMYLGLPDSYPDPLVRDMDPDPAPSIEYRQAKMVRKN